MVGVSSRERHAFILYQLEPPLRTASMRYLLASYYEGNSSVSYLDVAFLLAQTTPQYGPFTSILAGPRLNTKEGCYYQIDNG
jgi:hypothetical protein